MISFELIGANEILNALKSLQGKELLRIIKAVNRKALTKYIVNPIKAALPYSSKTKQGIKVTTVPGQPIALYAGATSKAFWLRFTEYGTKERTSKHGVTWAGIKSRKYIEPAIDSNVPNIINYWNSEVGEDISKKMKSKIKRLT